MPWFSKRSGGGPSDETPTRRGGSRLSLVVVEGADPGAELRLAPFDAELGRGDETRARGDRLTLRDRSVSTRQARLLPGADGWTLEHVASASNPTLLNGQKIERKLLAPGDRISIGHVVLEVRATALAPEVKTEIVRRAQVGAETTTIMRLGADAWGHLELVRGPSRLLGTRFPLSGERIRIGRQPDCDVLLLDPDVSRLHAELSRDGARVLLRHLSRTNPTSRNGKPISAETELAHGDEIGLAESVALRFMLANAPEVATQPTGLRKVMEARVELEAQLERDFVRDGSFLDVDIADSYGLKASEPKPERVFVSFERFRGYVAAQVSENEGRILNSNGDEVMAFFESADAAVRCARALLGALPEWNARENLLKREFRVRIGIHTGRSAVDLHHGVAYSPVLDVAGHLQKTAPIGGVLISEATRAALAGEPEGFAPGAKLARENLDTWVLAPEAPS